MVSQQLIDEFKQILLNDYSYSTGKYDINRLANDLYELCELIARINNRKEGENEKNKLSETAERRTNTSNPVN